MKCLLRKKDEVRFLFNHGMNEVKIAYREGLKVETIKKMLHNIHRYQLDVSVFKDFVGQQYTNLSEDDIKELIRKLGKKYKLSRNEIIKHISSQMNREIQSEPLSNDKKR